MSKRKYSKMSTEDFTFMCHALRPSAHEVTPLVSFEKLAREGTKARLGETIS